jgi:hypothetical protein
MLSPRTTLLRRPLFISSISIWTLPVGTGLSIVAQQSLLCPFNSSTTLTYTERFSLFLGTQYRLLSFREYHFIN